jgi:translation initiation factor IF-2
VPARILGLKGSPKVGDILKVETDQRVIRELKTKKIVKRFDMSNQMTPHETSREVEKKKLNLVIRADTLGSLEAIKESLKKFDHPEVCAEIVQSGLGNITEADVLRAETSAALLFGFNVVVTPAAESVARGKGIATKIYNVIYNLISDVRKRLEDLLVPEVIETELGRVKILGLFRSESNYQIIGGKVTAGKLVSGAHLRVMRGKEAVAEGKLSNLQVLKTPVSEVQSGQECGMKFEGTPVVQLNDVVIGFSREERKRSIGG